MTAPGDVVGQAVVNVRTCELRTPRKWGVGAPGACTLVQPHDRCPGCQGDGTWRPVENGNNDGR